MTKSSLGVVFRGCNVLWRSFTIPVWFTRYFNRTMIEWLTLNRSAVCLYDIPPITIPALAIFLHLTVSTCHVEIRFRKFKVLPVLHVQIPIWKPRHTWVLQRYRWTYKTLFRRSLINRPIQNYRYHERILYVIQLSDRVYNVTFPAQDLYSLDNPEKLAT